MNSIIEERMTRLYTGSKEIIYDKKLTYVLASELVNDMLCVKQEESHFLCWIATNREQMIAFKKWCKDNGKNYRNVNDLQDFIKEAKIIWKV